MTPTAPLTLRLTREQRHELERWCDANRLMLQLPGTLATVWAAAISRGAKFIVRVMVDPDTKAMQLWVVGPGHPWRLPVPTADAEGPFDSLDVLQVHLMLGEPP